MPKRASPADMLAQLKAKQVEVAREEKEACDLAAKLVKAVKGGRSTGDPMTDFVIRRYNKFEPQYEANLREISGLIKGHAGELVLVVCNETREDEILGRGQFCFLDEKLFLAELSQDELDFDPGKGGFPCVKHACADLSHDLGRIKVVEGNISWQLHYRDLIASWGEKMVYRLLPHCLKPKPPALGIELYVGQEAISAWADEQVFKMLRGTNHCRILLWAMSRAIGYPLPENEDVIGKRSSTLRAIRNSLRDATILHGQIEQVMESVGGDLLMKDGAITSPPESVGEARLRTSPQRDQLRSILASLRSQIEEARILGASEEELAPFLEEIESFK